MVLLRQRAGELDIDKRWIGVLGFSAGGHLATSISNAESLSYEPVDAADRQPTRPDFAIALYSGHLWSGRGVDLYPFNRISRNAPPTFLVHALDDPVDDVRHSIAYFLALRAVGVPAAMHIYATGGHAFALRRTKAPITRWSELAETWLRAIGML